jgi:tRNA (cmo5U34)-methyltransferase
MRPEPGIADAFNAAARTYDSERRLLISCFDRFYGTGVAALTPALEQGGTVLDLGAGTGLFSGLIAARFAQSSFVLMDVAEALLILAQARLAGRAVQIRNADYVTAPFGGPYAAVVSGLSIHHLSDADKADVYRKAYTALRPGGVFVNADQVLGPTPALEASYRAQWLEAARGNGAPGEAIAQAQDRMRFDRMAPLADQLRWLAEAGFAEIDCPFKDYSFAVMTGLRRA